MLVAPFNDLETTTRLIAEHAGELAAVVLEPLQRCVVPLDGFLGGVLRVAREHHVVTVFDEVVTGFRLAWGGGQEYYRAECDIAAYGKALSGGYALAAVAARDHGALRPAHRRAGTSTPSWAARCPATRSARPPLATLTELEKPASTIACMRSGTVSERAGGGREKRRAAAPGARRGPCFQPLISEHR